MFDAWPTVVIVEGGDGDETSCRIDHSLGDATNGVWLDLAYFGYCNITC